jgi:wobble nucleotide-excising tRNase
LHKDYDTATFEVELENGTKCSHLQLTDLSYIRVFNTDYIKENLKWGAGEEGIESILLVGKENIKLEEELKKYKVDLEVIKENTEKLENSVQIERDKIETGFTDKAREIKTTLNILNYDKRDLEPIVKSVADAPEKYGLPDEKLQEYRRKYHSTDKKETIPQITLPIPDISSHCNQTETLLKRTATANVIERLRENRNLEKWVEDGIELHENESVCQFCGGILRSDLLDNLNAHFSEAYKQLMTEINQLADTLRNKEVSDEPPLPEKAEFYPELQKDYEQSKQCLKSEVKTFNKIVEELLKMIDDKKIKPFEVVTFRKPQDKTDDLKKAIASVNIVIQKHKKITDEFEKEKKAAKEKLIKNWASEFAITVNYNETIKEIGKRETEIETQNRQQGIILKKIHFFEQQSSDAVKGARKINEYLHDYFGTAELKMSVAEDEKYLKLERSGHRAYTAPH